MSFLISKFIRSDHPLVSYKYLIFPIFPLPLALQMVESRKTTSLSQFVQLPDTPTHFHRPSMSRSTKLAKALNPSPKESESSTVTSITYLRHLLILPTKLHPDSSTLSVFQDFQFPPPTPPNVDSSGRDLK